MEERSNDTYGANPRKKARRTQKINYSTKSKVGSLEEKSTDN